MGMLDEFDWGKMWNSPSMKMAKDAWNTSLPGKVTSALAAPVVSGVTYPKDLWDEKEAPPIPSQNPDLSRAADVFGLMPAGGAIASATKQIPAGAIGTFAGPYAKHAPIKDYMKGARLERKGANADDIWHDARVFRQPGGYWSHEIPNRDDAFKLPHGRYLNLPSQGPVRDLYNIPELGRNYPELLDIPLDIRPSTGLQEGMYGRFSGRELGKGGDHIEIAGPPRTLKSTLTHELNHAVDVAEKRFGTMDPNYRGTSSIDPLEYLMSPAERMARAAENRANWTLGELREIHPLKTPEEPALQNFIDRELAKKAGDQKLFEKLLDEARVRGYGTTPKREVGNF